MWTQMQLFANLHIKTEVVITRSHYRKVYNTVHINVDTFWGSLSGTNLLSTVRNSFADIAYLCMLDYGV